MTPNINLETLTTESANNASEGFDTKSALDIARIINHEDAKINAAVKKAMPEIAIVIDIVARSLRDGGRLIYVGAGSSGRIAALDASECPPSYSTLPRRCSTSWPAAPRLSPPPSTSTKILPRSASATSPAAAPPAKTSSSAYPPAAAHPTSSPPWSMPAPAAPRPQPSPATPTPRSRSSPTPPSSPRSAPRSSPAPPA